MYTTENLPDIACQFSATETKRYRECICQLFNLHFASIDGAGDCFFSSVAMLLERVPNAFGITYTITSSSLRARVVEWLRKCGSSADDISQECCLHMTHELVHPLTLLVGNKWVSRTPVDVDDYLQLSSQDGVWVAGRTPPYTTTIHHHHTPPPYTTTIVHHTPPPYTTATTHHYPAHNIYHRFPLATRGRNHL